ncbi:helix-turn-helix domain-containing protein [Listeria newyorkensis]|uniref:Helix-turn-helix transcriptional regulator n=1 Tax=Listeria newyorkensis TaxID=1497681 RepID=A0A841YX69_9LIST|nr:helix-turn-helix transcriptional regulator [Listeria newyorkensis]MBC1457898.1 helix-turn-helix transcriptional regulator [Listeria newyorkensis]
MKLIGDAIKKKRTDIKMKMSDLAIKIGTSQSAISLIENGKRLPNEDTLKRICDALEMSDIDYHELLKERENWLNGDVKVTQYESENDMFFSKHDIEKKNIHIQFASFAISLLEDVGTKIDITNNFERYGSENELTQEIISQFVKDAIMKCITNNEAVIKSDIEKRVGQLMKDLFGYTK